MANGNWQQEILIAEAREKEQRRALENPFGMLVTAVSPLTEQATFSYYGNRGRTVEINHPFVSSSSWIRAIPDAGSQYVGVFRADEANPQPITTVQRGNFVRIKAYLDGQEFYRTLYPGEIESSSSGQAQVFLSRRPKAEVRGGVTSRWSDQDTLTVGDRAPVHTKQLLTYKAGQLGDEMRVGVVTRPKRLLGALAIAGQTHSTWEQSYPKVRDNFAAEYFIDLKNPAGSGPSTLFSVHRGHVLDIDGNTVLQGRTQIPLRARERYFSVDDSETIQEIDEKGNLFLQLATSAAEGLDYDVPSGNFSRTIGLDESAIISGNMEYAVGKDASFQIDANYTLIAENNLRFRSNTADMEMLFSSTPGSEQWVVKSKSGHIITLDDTTNAEAMYFIHKGGSQITIDDTGSIKIVAQDGSLVFMDTDQGAITATSKGGAFVTLREEITIADKTGKQILTLDGTDTLQISADSDVVLNAKKVTIKGGSIDIGDLATFSAVMAEPLALLFDSHTHATVMGPTTPPLPPNTAALVNVNPATSFANKFVKIRGNI